MTIPTATGHRRDLAEGPYCEWTRTFRAPIEDVWAAVTEPQRLARWLGTWTGDPASGEVKFQMTFEDEMPAERFRIDECDAPHRLWITTSMTDGENTEHWQLRLDLAEEGGITTLTFAQNVPDPTMVESVGPGWDYYLDRLVAAEADRDPATVSFEDYYPALSEHYRKEFGRTQ
ncbi:SRPBCC family protein [Nocardia sp. IBHARD005]|uniref:SRPBCC family protein n=1 Tax=Nocardia sp. IBHARD005 TaxID=3457765 RepID=UPI00405973A6